VCPYYRRRLPHWQPEGQVFFITSRLFGSLPASAIERLRFERERLEKEPERKGELLRQRALRQAKRMFGLLDEALAAEAERPEASSPQWLRDSKVAVLVRDAIHHREGNLWQVHRYVVMPNHLHLLIEPLPVENSEQTVKQANGNPEAGADLKDACEAPCSSLAVIMHGLKLYTARRANRLLGRSGAFWQDENYDHWVRDGEEYDRIVYYIDHNPVKAGLCRHPAEWPWSSAGEVGQVANLPSDPLP